jgi:antitoxin component of MazEF toxin-antitoxin module
MSAAKQKFKNERTVYYADYEPLNGRRNVYPVIRLGGKYLRQFGFEIGDKIDVAVNKEQITIRKINREASPEKEQQIIPKKRRSRYKNNYRRRRLGVTPLFNDISSR